MSDAPIFVVGCPRSGTTLLRDLLRAHPRLSFPPESRWIPALYRAHGDPRDARGARRAAADLLGTWEVVTWRLDLQPSDLEHHRTFSGLVAQLYETWAGREGKPRWGDKTPLYVHELDVILGLFPEAQVINLVRDGRDVALSLIRQPWGPSNAYTAAVMWRRAVDAGRRAAATLSPQSLLEVRYEALLTDPEPQLRRICAFLGEPFDPAMLSPNRLPTPSGRDNPWPVHREARIDRSNAEHWRTGMTPTQRAVFESAAGDELRRAGYPDTAGSRELPWRRRAAWWARDAVHWLYWRLDTWDRGPRARTTAILLRAWLLARWRGAGRPQR